MILLVHVSLICRIYAYICLEVEFSGTKSSYISSLPDTNSSPARLRNVYFPNRKENFSVVHPCEHELLWYYLDFSHFESEKQNLIKPSVFISWLSNEAKQFFLSCIAMCVYPSVNCFLKYLSLFFYWAAFFYHKYIWYTDSSVVASQVSSHRLSRSFYILSAIQTFLTFNIVKCFNHFL